MVDIIKQYSYQPLAMEHGVSPQQPLSDIAKWQALKKQFEQEGKYMVGSWATWEPQAAVYQRVVEDVVNQHGPVLNILRLGLASPECARQEWRLLKKAGVSKRKLQMFVSDINYTPLEFANTQKISGRQFVVQADVRNIPFASETMDLVTSHFLFSYPQAGRIEGKLINLLAIISPIQQITMSRYKNKILKSVYHSLKKDGIFLMAQGINPKPGFWHSKEEIIESLRQAGFSYENIKVIPTTDPYDHREEDGELVPIEGINYIFMARK